MAPQTRKLPEHSTTNAHRPQRSLPIKFIAKAALALFIAYAAGYYNIVRLNPPWPRPITDGNRHVICRPPLPPLKTSALDLNDYHIRRASYELDQSLRKLASLDGLDSITVAVVTPDGPVFSKGYGVRRANETVAQRGQVDEDTIYRLASVSKMFTVLELWILKERGALEWYVAYLYKFRYSNISHSLQGTTTSPSTCPSSAISQEDGQNTRHHILNIPAVLPNP
jgi:hypothetical protein